MGTIKGWVQVTERTAVRFENGKPTRISSTANDLDAAADAAAQYVGEPLEVGEWERDESNPAALGEARLVPWAAPCALASEPLEQDSDARRRA